MTKPRKILILGSGALKIGEAGEFDYSGSQAIKAFKEEGIKTALINPNIATYQTSEFLADEVYFLPVTADFVEKVIQKEKPDAISVSFGGQTALNCGMELYKKGILKKYQISILGTPIESVVLSEDRQAFADHLKKINVNIPVSHAAESLIQAKKIAQKIGYPVMVRAGFALGGQKSGVAHDKKELEKTVNEALSFSQQVLIEKYLHHYKEIEYEIVRDSFDNCVAICNMENMDPLGIHTGESIVVAPSQTLSNYEYHYLRKEAIRIVRSLNIVGECNVQFALNPKKSQYFVIEMNARLSRSSALASKATGYPLAYVAAKLALGKNLTEIKNQVTGVTQSFFEPALDYLVVKIPRWDLEKFQGIEERIGSSMKSVGEVMAIGRTFEEAIQKAVRMLDIGLQGVTDNRLIGNGDSYSKYVKTPTPKRLFAITEALRKGMSIKMLYAITGIDPWYLYRLKNIVDLEQALIENNKIDNKNLQQLKQNGFSDRRIAELVGSREIRVRELRKKWGIVPSVFQIDTLAGEVPAKTNYLYLTYNGSHHDVEPLRKAGVIVLGSGTYRIGSSVEFDWTCVNTATSLKKHGKRSIIVNCNPETVSTDYDISDRLYFEEITFERVVDIAEFEESLGIVISVGGQTPNNIAQRIDQYGLPILGTAASDIDRAEDRKKFSRLLDDLGIDQPAWNSFTDQKAAIAFANKIGYPVLIRPSYVLSGAAMAICYNDDQLKYFFEKAAQVNSDYPVTISKFITNAKEIEMDGVAEKGVLQVSAISEHIEYGGVHSGDATIVYPSQHIYVPTERKIMEITEKLAAELNITGPFNIQFLAIENKVYVIEMNLRASRTFPFISKATGVNFASVSVDCFFHKSQPRPIKYPQSIIVKVPQFSFARLSGADPVLKVEMASTGEVASFGESAEEAYLKSVFASGMSIREKVALISLGGQMNKELFLESARQLKTLGFKLYATRRTHTFLKYKGIETVRVHKIYQNKEFDVLSIIRNKKVHLVVHIPERIEKITHALSKQESDGHVIRRSVIDNNIPLLTDLNTAIFFIHSLHEYQNKQLSIKSWREYQ